MRLLLDENVHLSLVSSLAKRGHDVRHVALDLDSSVPDFDVLGAATSEGRVLITNDSDFGGLVYGQDLRHAGVIYLRLHHLSFQAQIPFILRTIEAQEAEPGRFLVVTPSRIRSAGPR